MLWKSRLPVDVNLEEGIRKHTVLSMPVPRSLEFGSSYSVTEFCFWRTAFERKF